MQNSKCKLAETNVYQIKICKKFSQEILTFLPLDFLGVGITEEKFEYLKETFWILILLKSSISYLNFSKLQTITLLYDF